MELATSIGISISEFWEITPYELTIALRGYGKRKEREAEEYTVKLKNERMMLVEQALLLSRWVWQKKISKQEINEALGIERQKNKQMSDDAMLNQVKMLNKLFGGEVKIDGNEE